jgi:hypothetical protein
MIKTINNKGRKEISAYFLKTLKMKALKIFKRVWPASIFAKSRTDKLNGLIRYETISIITRNGIRGFGTPLGTNKLKNSSLLLKKFIKVIPKNNEKAIWKVKIIWPVIVKP